MVKSKMERKEKHVLGRTNLLFSFDTWTAQKTKKLGGIGRQAPTQQGDLISLLLFFQN
jgi:hypothetical protein